MTKKKVEEITTDPEMDKKKAFALARQAIREYNLFCTEGKLRFIEVIMKDMQEDINNWKK